MKKIMKIIISSFVIAVMLASIPFESSCSKLENDVLRLHILANSDSVVDQKLKLEVRNKVLYEISPLYNTADTKEVALKITQENLELIENVAKNTIATHSKDYEVNARITNKFFDTRYYEKFTMPAGMYDTLEITIGEGEGKNWWCVMYPTLCVGAASSQSMKNDLSDDEYSVVTSSDIEFRFKIVEYFEKINSFFR